MKKSTLGLLVLAGPLAGVWVMNGVGCANNAELEEKWQATAEVKCESVDDQNPCTIDECADGQVTYTNREAGVVDGCIGVCDGNGECVKRDNGSGCTIPDECASGYCIDDVCCESTCDGTCKSCNVPDSPGVCTNVDVMVEDGDCKDGRACNGSGECMIATGKSCDMGTDCVGEVCRGKCQNNLMKSCYSSEGCGGDACLNEICMIKKGLPCAGPTDTSCFESACEPVPDCDEDCMKYTCQ